MKKIPLLRKRIKTESNLFSLIKDDKIHKPKESNLSLPKLVHPEPIQEVDENKDDDNFDNGIYSYKLY